ncbi:CAP domain-containing protein [Polymorphobacter sp.]|uniref:CAP domain-containing protein n=1 Tax=Polymorphobacter sp. TaxID=1909290 RepID=UPI003F71CBFB
MAAQRAHSGRWAWPAALSLLVLLTGAADAEPIIAAEPPDFMARVMALHNRARAEVKVPPLVWDEALVADARLWATALARQRLFEHDQTNRPEPQGENLFMGTAGAYSVEEMIGEWVSERALLRGPGDWLASFPAVGHYTQMVWRTTSRVGCAMMRNGEDDYLVCRYRKAGNVMGEPVF